MKTRDGFLRFQGGDCYLLYIITTVVLPFDMCGPLRRQHAAGQIEMARVVRGFLARLRLKREAAAVTVVQAGYRGYNARKVLETSRAAQRQLEARTTTVQVSETVLCYSTTEVVFQVLR